MLLSMTGYGRATGHFGEKTILAEVRALNSKMTDLKLRFPGDYKEKELELRKLVTDHAERGNVFHDRKPSRVVDLGSVQFARP